MSSVSISNYGNTETKQHNTIRVDMGPVTVWFSYTTPVAFQAGYGTEIVVRENEWGPTTGKHLAWIDGGDREAKKARVSGEEFERRLSEIMSGFEYREKEQAPDLDDAAIYAEHNPNV